MEEEIFDENTGDIKKIKKKITSYQIFRNVIDDEQYDIIRKKISEIKSLLLRNLKEVDPANEMVEN